MGAVKWQKYDYEGKLVFEKSFDSVNEAAKYFKSMKDPNEEEIENGCWNCMNYDGNRCTKEWNNLDPCYYIDWRDDKAPDDHCEDWVLEPDAIYEQFFGGDE